MTFSRRRFMELGVLAGLAATRGARVLAQGAPESGYAGAVVIDGCGGPGDFHVDSGVPLSDRAVRQARGSGVTAVNLTVGPVGNLPDAAAFEGIVRDIAYWTREMDVHPDALVQVKRAKDLAAAKRSFRLGLIFGLQDGVAFATDLSRLEVLRNLGVIIIQPTYNLRNLLGDGCLEPGDAGLSRRGHDAIERMNALGILVDLSHCSRRTTADAIAASARPVAFTHTGCAAVHDHPRNKTDAQLKALADRGGVAGIYVMPYLRPKGQPEASDVVRHLEHALNVAGEDHVGIGTDGTLSPVELTPEFLSYFQAETAARKKTGIGAPGEDPNAYLFAADLNTPRRLETLAAMLAKRGHPASRVERILGGNFARLFAEVWGPSGA